MRLNLTYRVGFLFIGTNICLNKKLKKYYAIIFMSVFPTKFPYFNNNCIYINEYHPIQTQ